MPVTGIPLPVATEELRGGPRHDGGAFADAIS